LHTAASSFTDGHTGYCPYYFRALIDSDLRLRMVGRSVEGAPFGRYRLIELLGRGGMGEVWRAHDTATNNRNVAIKLLPPQLAADHTFVRRFRREADAAARLNNPHIIPIHTVSWLRS
jgi:serine/threonine protein kinase